MTMIKEIDYDLLKWLDEQDQPCGLIQQLNCFCTQSGGIAHSIRLKYPSVFDADIRFGMRGDNGKMGKFCVVEVVPNKFCYGYYGQYNFGMQRRHTNYEAVYIGLSTIKHHAVNAGLKKLGLPKFMGCSLGGGKWNIVRAIIEDIFANGPIELTICNYNK